MYFVIPKHSVAGEVREWISYLIQILTAILTLKHVMINVNDDKRSAFQIKFTEMWYTSTDV